MSSFHNRKRAAQLIDFEGLQWGKLRPTDIDLSIDWQGKTFVFVELKGKWQDLTVGQRIHLESIVKAINAGGKTAFAVLAKHDTDANEDILAKDCFGVRVFDGNAWEDSPKKDLGSTLEALYQLHLKLKISFMLMS